MKCLQCGEQIDFGVCPSCGFNVKTEEFSALYRFGVETIVHALKPHKLREMDVFYIVRGKTYTYKQAKKIKKFDPKKGDKKIIRYLNEDGSMSNEEPTDDEIRRYLENER